MVRETMHFSHTQKKYDITDWFQRYYTKVDEEFIFMQGKTKWCDESNAFSNLNRLG